MTKDYGPFPQYTQIGALICKKLLAEPFLANDPFLLFAPFAYERDYKDTQFCSHISSVERLFGFSFITTPKFFLNPFFQSKHNSLYKHSITNLIFPCNDYTH